MGVIHIASHNPVPTVERKVERYDTQRSCHVFVLTAWRAKSVAESVAIIAAQSDAQAFHGVVIDAQNSCKVVGNLELVWACGSVVSEVFCREALGVQSRQELSLIAPILYPSPQRKPYLVPSVWQDGCFAFGTIAGEELIRLVVGIGITDRHDDFSCLNVELPAPKGFVYPKLLDVHLSTFLYFCFVFASLFCLNLNGRTRAAMLELNLAAHRPALTEVIADVQANVGQVETSVAFVVLVVLRHLVAIEALAVEVAGHHGLAIASKGKARKGFLQLPCLFCLRRSA